MTLEIDLERVEDVTARLGHHRTMVETVRDHLIGVGHRTGLDVEAAPAVDLAQQLAGRLGLTADLLAVQARRVTAADDGSELRSFAGGSLLCSAIQVASPIPSRPSTSGVTGAIDGAGIAMDAGSLLQSAASPAGVAARSVPVAALAAAVADTLLCRLRVGSGAAISTRTIVNDDGEQVYESSRSEHKNLTKTGEPLKSDPVQRDAQLWRIEHRDEQGFVTEPYPGYPAYPANAPKE